MITPEQLRAFAVVMREQGITRIESGDLSIEMGDVPAAVHVASLTADDTLTRAEYEERLLFASVEGFPEEPRQ